MQCGCDMSRNYDDCEYEDVIISHEKSNLDLKCCECNQEIPKGEKHELCVFKTYDDDSDIDYRTCKLCEEVRNAYFCDWMYESIWEDMQDREDDEGLSLGILESLSKEARDKFFDMIDIEMEELY